MLGAIAIIVVCCIVIPVAVLMSGAAMAAILGWFVQDDVERAHPDSELIELNR